MPNEGISFMRCRFCKSKIGIKRFCDDDIMPRLLSRLFQFTTVPLSFAENQRIYRNSGWSTGHPERVGGSIRIYPESSFHSDLSGNRIPCERFHRQGTGCHCAKIFTVFQPENQRTCQSHGIQ